MSNLVKDLTGGVIAPHLVERAVGDLPVGDISIKVVEVFDENPEHATKYSENYEVRVEYPDGVIIGHQIPKTDTTHQRLLEMIRNKLRGRHGLPKSAKVAEGEHRLNHVAGDLITEIDCTTQQLAGKTLTFKHI